jgi:hypothetical protein
VTITVVLYSKYAASIGAKFRTGYSTDVATTPHPLKHKRHVSLSLGPGQLSLPPYLDLYRVSNLTHFRSDFFSTPSSSVISSTSQEVISVMSGPILSHSQRPMKLNFSEKMKTQRRFFTSSFRPSKQVHPSSKDVNPNLYSKFLKFIPMKIFAALPHSLLWKNLEDPRNVKSESRSLNFSYFQNEWTVIQ